MRRRGFTLIEVMVAMLVFSMLATLVYSGFSQATRNRERLKAQNAFFQSTSLSLERMARELSMAYVSTHLNPSFNLRESETGFIGRSRLGRDRVDFASFAHRRMRQDAKESDQSEIGYFLTRDPEARGTRSYVLARREQFPIDKDPKSGGRIVGLVKNVESLELRYLDPQSWEWLRSWDTTQGATGQPNRLPAQVKIILKVRPPYNSDTVLTFGTRAVLGIRWGLNHANYNP